MEAIVVLSKNETPALRALGVCTDGLKHGVVRGSPVWCASPDESLSVDPAIWGRSEVSAAAVMLAATALAAIRAETTEDGTAALAALPAVRTDGVIKLRTPSSVTDAAQIAVGVLEFTRGQAATVAEAAAALAAAMRAAGNKTE